MSNHIDDLIGQLKRECGYCGGQGLVSQAAPHRPDAPQRHHCWDCHGRGWVFTPAGRELAAVLAVGLQDAFAPASHGHSYLSPED